ncbi:MAG: hypothetical protein ACXIU7_11405 [Roseinatronobacter sp.]
MDRASRLMRLYLQMFLHNLRNESDQDQLAAKTAAMMAAATAIEVHRLGSFGAAERLRDLADQIEREAETVN